MNLIYEPDSIQLNSSYIHLTQLPVRIRKWSKVVTVGRGPFFPKQRKGVGTNNFRPLEPCREHKTRDVVRHLIRK